MEFTWEQFRSEFPSHYSVVNMNIVQWNLYDETTKVLKKKYVNFVIYLA